MTTGLNIGTSANNIPTWSLSFSPGSDLFATANTQYAIPVPPNSTDALIESTGNIYVSPNPITLPTSSILTTSTRINPEMVKVGGTTTLYITTLVDSYVKVSF